MKNCKMQRLRYWGVPIAADIICICGIIYNIIKHKAGYIGLAFCLLLIAVQLYTAYKATAYFKRFVNALANDMDLVSGDLRLDYRNSFQSTSYSRLYSKLFRIQESKRVYIEKQHREMNVIHQMISDISHQVKTPITTAKTYSQMMLKPQKDGQEAGLNREYMQVVNAQIDKLDFLMQALLKISRLETNMIALQPQVYNLENILAESYVGVLYKAEKKNIEVRANYKGRQEAFVDYKWTIEAIFNIIDNAVKYTQKGGIIEVDISDSANFKIVSIKDNGCGIEESKLPLIFKRFYREQKSKEVEGVGLGLSLCREIIEKEHGYIRVQSAVNKGSIFLVYLPKTGKGATHRQ